jgi:hypothetical protein
LELYDATGRHVRTLAVGAGKVGVRWDAEDSSGRRVRSGIYLARYLDSETQVNTRVVVLR